MQGKYPERKWAEEAACRLVQHIIAKYGIESFLTANMSGNNEKVAKLATVLQYYFNNGKEKTNNYIRHRQSSGTGTAVDGQEKADKRQQGRLGRTGVDTRTVGATFESDQRSGSSDRLESQFGTRSDETEDIWNDQSLGLDEQRQSVTRLRLLEVFHLKIPRAILELCDTRGNGLPGWERHAMAFEHVNLRECQRAIVVAWHIVARRIAVAVHHAI